MTTLREAAALALEALEDAVDHLPKPNSTECGHAITALRTALSEPEQEPVAWRYQNSLTDTEYLVWNKGIGGRNWTPLYTHPVDDTALLRKCLDALEAGDWYIDQLEMIVYSADDTGTHEERAKVQAAITALRERLGEKT